MCVHFQGCTSYRVLQHGIGRRFFVEAAAVVRITVYGLQENLVDDRSCGLSVWDLGLVVVYVIRLWDSMLLHHVELL